MPDAGRGSAASRASPPCTGGLPPSAVAYCGVSGRPHDSERTAHGDPGHAGPGRRALPALPCGDRRGGRAVLLHHAPGARLHRRGARDARAALGAPQPGSGGWYWPIGTEDFQGWSGWLEPRGSYVHVAQDMPCADGHAVYAIGDGIVFISRADTGGYGVGGAPGGCIIISHVTAGGDAVPRALRARLQPEGQGGRARDAGQVIALVNGCRHLHFSIHPGTKYRDGNPYAGHVPTSWADHGGYVDPVKFLKTNPRAVGYVPPALPRVEITTEASAAAVRRGRRRRLLDRGGAAGSVTWRAGPRDRRARGARTRARRPALRHAPLRHRAARGAGARLHRQRPPPVTTLKAAHDTPPWGADAELAASPHQRRRRSRCRGACSSCSGSHGPLEERGARRDRRGRRGRLPLHAVGGDLAARGVRPAGDPAGGPHVSRRAKPGRDRDAARGAHHPAPPAVVDAADLVTATGELLPRHPAGEHTVRLVFQRRGAGGDWVTRRRSPR